MQEWLWSCDKIDRMIGNRPYFLWDYDLTERGVREVLRGSNQTDKIWMLSRILESARFEDVWKYISLSEVKSMFHLLKLKPAVRRAWEHALTVWQ
ncbi:MAG: hypothetical protein UX80_C0017G0005 [Candidatus Amesbacteria bacterium GW2011_GWA2_47_11b]|uniref:BRCT domain-containing protein n=3 Tax=Candidatus Amesiibacteriota TaxID=1752730 RepID=A0A0G1SGM0_9BACT|nr:MAG: hypothetical protein UX42_C0024G0014 [Microgenomates group bacterium GW2011_GWC1_46_20]KKU57387.1 MAG: hypothetical protein UX80_C0017G0005 [Candidatus Amesbacteria bacterium GW2011_GWA2_47_11b]KKU68579.1 MAG: hypothetical protein UX92_C0019G0014 [Candidatus Amesbacteria bacterium GW2011_GWA1_47_20]KKU82957.1 MAG: hypothetical protein UY11_C0034G0010 [Candidatus Amesbacteria bacterium GW2011_GWC2_47_8]